MTDSVRQQCSSQEEAMAQGLARGWNNLDAYRFAYTSELDSNATIKSQYEMACRKANRPLVRERLRELQAELEAEALWTRIDSVRTLAEIARGVDPRIFGEHDDQIKALLSAAPKAADRVNAVKALNTMHGWDRPEAGDAEQLIAAFARLIASRPD